MRLTVCLLRRNYFPNGDIYRGKNRLVQKVTPLDLLRMKRDLIREDNNMLLLRHPFLTVAESHGHAAALDKYEKYIDRFRMQKDIKKKTVLMEDILGHLNVTKSWE